jgi:hypothetical protein
MALALYIQSARVSSYVVNPATIVTSSESTTNKNFRLAEPGSTQYLDPVGRSATTSGLAFSGAQHLSCLSLSGPVSVTRTPASATSSKVHPQVHYTGQQPQSSQDSACVALPQVKNESDSPVKRSNMVRQSQVPKSPSPTAQSGSLSMSVGQARSSNNISLNLLHGPPMSSLGPFEPLE